MWRRIGVILTVLAVSACGDGSASDGWGFDTIDLPDTIAEIAAVYDSMPGEVAGYPRFGEPDGEHLVTYGAEDEVGPSMWNQSGEYRVIDGEILNPRDFLTFMVGTGEIEVIDSDLDSDIVWVEVSTTVGDQTGEWIEYMLAVGDAEGEYLFFFNAASPPDLEALVDAFVETAGA